MPKVSVIMPVYNTEQYLNRCLDSLLSQTLKDIEIICVDDGSTDRSLEILKKYASIDNRIKIIQKENSGVGDSGNKGLDEAKGEYVCFVDSDDWIDIDFLEKLFFRASRDNLDWVKGNVLLEYSKSSLLSRLHKEVYHQLELGKHIACCLFRDWWSILYKKEIIEKYNLKFTNHHLAEDTLFLISYLCYAEKFALVDETYYHYFQRPNSLVHTYRSDDWKDVLVTTQKIGNIFNEQHIDNISVVYFMEIRFKYFLSFFDFVKQYSSLAERQEYVEEVVKFSSYLHRLGVSSELAHISGEKEIEKCLKCKKTPFITKLFSVKNSRDKRYKVITILGIKIKIKRRKSKI